MDYELGICSNFVPKKGNMDALVLKELTLVILEGLLLPSHNLAVWKDCV